MADLYTVLFKVGSEPTHARFEFEANARSFARVLAFAGKSAKVIDEFEPRDSDDKVVVEHEAQPIPNGVYLVGDTPKALHPLAVEDGSGDRALLREALSEHDADPASNHPDVRDFVVDRVEDLDDEHEHGAPVSQVLEETANRFALGTAFDVVRDLHRTGDVYAPTDTTLRQVVMGADE